MGAETTVMAKKSTPVRISDEAIGLARIASGYTGESMSEYVSRIIVERAAEDIERSHAAFKQAKSTPDKPEH